MQTIWNKTDDPITWEHVEIVAPDGHPVAGAVGCDVTARYVLVEVAPPPPERPAEEAPETPSRRRGVSLDPKTPLRRSASGPVVEPPPFVPVPLRIYLDFDVVHRRTRAVLHRVRRF